jgi:hypothetical protein
MGGAGAGRFAAKEERFLVEKLDRSWANFWQRAVQGNNDLPKWKGAPQASITLDCDGNRCLTLAQRDDTNFVFVEYMTS